MARQFMKRAQMCLLLCIYSVLKWHQILFPCRGLILFLNIRGRILSSWQTLLFHQNMCTVAPRWGSASQKMSQNPTQISRCSSAAAPLPSVLVWSFPSLKSCSQPQMRSRHSSCPSAASEMKCNQTEL